MPTAPPTKRVLQTLAWLIENEIVEDIKPSKLQSELDIDRTTIRGCLDCMVAAEVATVNVEGITRVYALAIKLPKAKPKSKLSKEQAKAQKDLEARAFQERVRFSKSPREPMWVVVPKFYEELKESPDLVKAEDIYDAEVNYDYLAGTCPDCKQTFLAMDFDKRQWRCIACAKAWLGDTVFRADSEDIEIC